MPLIPPARLLPRLAPALLLVACGGNQLSQSWQLDRLRVLGVQASPAEPRPGDTVTFDSLVYLPPGVELELTTWFACLPESADDFGCELDTTAFSELQGQDLDDLSPEEQAALFEELLEAGLIGAEPFLPPTWTAPADALDGLDETDRLEGVSAVVNVTAIPAGATSDADLELAYKRVPVSEATTPNDNPVLAHLLVDGVEIAPGSTIRWTWEEPLPVDAVLTEDSIQQYTYRSADGTEETRTEEPFITWYTEAGRFDQEYSLYPESAVEWTPPAEEGEDARWGIPADGQTVELLAVVRDRRGGMAWAGLTVELVPPEDVDLSGVEDEDTGAPTGATGRACPGAVCEPFVRAP